MLLGTVMLSVPTRRPSAGVSLVASVVSSWWVAAGDEHPGEKPSYAGGSTGGELTRQPDTHLGYCRRVALVHDFVEI